MKIKAIETRYEGYRFRSRLEARWAVFFDAIGYEWSYEPEGYALPSGHYLPDFLIKSWKYPSFFEIKGQSPTEIEIQKMIELSRLRDLNCYLVVGEPGEDAIIYHFDPDTLDPKIYDVYGFWDWRSPFDVKDNAIGDAVRTARAARFEHGEKPR